MRGNDTDTSFRRVRRLEPSLGLESSLGLEVREARAHARALTPFARPLLGPALAQLARGLASFFVSWAALCWCVHAAPWLAPLCMVPIAASMILLFVIQHDCGHRAFFRSRAANDWTGRVLGALTVLPYGAWRSAHDVHHATSGDLSRRGIGDIETLTVREFLGLGPRERLVYRLRRHPLVFLGLGGLYLFVANRTPQRIPGRSRRSMWISTQGTNLGMLVFWALGAWALGSFWLMVALQITLVMLYFVGGIWLFFVEHQFPEARWEAAESWDLHVAALQGSSFVDLPMPLRWFAGGIGVHHAHHLKVKVPNYRMDEALAANALLASVNRLTFREALRTHRLALWDEGSGRLVTFQEVEPRPVRQVAQVATGGTPCRA